MITGECLRRPWSPQVFKHLRMYIKGEIGDDFRSVVY